MTSAPLDYPFHVDGRGRIASTTADDHVRDMIEQVLFTNPGERVNRPDFGCGLLLLVFEPNSQPLAIAVQATVRGALQRWLGDAIQLEAVEVVAEESTLLVTVAYRLRTDGVPQVARFTRSLPT